MAEMDAATVERLKLSGYEFWRKTLNAAQLVVAPMVDQSELAWRMLSRRYSAQLCYTPMFHSSVFCRDEKYRRESLKSCPEDRPLILQFCGNDPDTLVKAGMIAQDHCDAIDINLGCPQAIAKRGHYGSFLQDEWELLQKIVTHCNKHLKVPVTCKVRIFRDINKTVQYAKMLEAAGCQLLTVHGRTRDQKGPATGLASWAHIKAVKENVSIPVFANGNIQYLSDVEKCIAATGVDGVMSAEGNLRNPAMYSGINPPVWQMAEEYLEFVDKYPCPLSYVRGHLFKIMQHSLLVHTVQRTQLGSAKSISEARDIVKQVKEASQKDVENYKISPEQYTATLPLPYWLCQPYERPPMKEHESEKVHKRCHADEGIDGADDTASPDNPENLSKKKLKKMKRYPNKTFRAEPLKLDLCTSCLNQRGQKCVHQLCKPCCKKKCSAETVVCEGHYNSKIGKKLQDQDNNMDNVENTNPCCDSSKPAVT